MSSANQPLMEGRDSNGIPLKSDYDAMCPEPKSIAALYLTFGTFLSAIGAGIAVAIWKFAEPAKSIEKVGILAHFELGPVYLAIFVVKYGFTMISANMGHARRACKVNVPDQHVYRVFGGPANGSIVLMETEGVFGAFNRAQRALANLEEVLPIFLVEVLLVGFVFPLITSCAVVFFAVMRYVGAVGYSKSAKGRMGGNMSAMIVMAWMDGFLAFIGIMAILKTHY